MFEDYLDYPQNEDSDFKRLFLSLLPPTRTTREWVIALRNLDQSSVTVNLEWDITAVPGSVGLQSVSPAGGGQDMRVIKRFTFNLQPASAQSITIRATVQ